MAWRYLTVIAFGNLVWEVVQLPLYTIWTDGTNSEIAFALVHCTVGDVLIAGFSIGLAMLVLGHGALRTHAWRVASIAIPLGIGYTIFSEWLNVSVRGSWAYAPAMPVLPVLGTGVTPLVQWIAVPALGFWFIARKKRAA